MDTSINNSRIFLTGSTGYIGRYLLIGLLKHNFRVNALIRSRNKVRQTANLKIFYGDLADQKNIKLATGDVAIIIHLAASLNVYEDGLLKKTNIDGLKKILLELDDNPTVKRFIFASTVDVKVRKNDYSASKINGEILVKRLCNKKSIDYVIVRLGNVYGGAEGGMIKGIIDLIKKNNWKSSVLYYLLGTKTLRLIEINDLVTQLIDIAENRNIKNQTIEIAGQKRTIKQIVDSLKKKEVISKLPKFNFFAPIFFYFWELAGRIMKKADLLIYLNTEK